MTMGLEGLDEIVKVQCSEGNWNANPYMMGLANGLLLAQAIVTSTDYKPLSAPEKWLDDLPAKPGRPIEVTNG